MDEMKRSHLRGRGGAGFPTATKFEGARNAPGAQRYVVCNADEGEPGTFKDRVLLNAFAVRVLEGMAISAYAVGATKGFIYLRGEYKHLQEQLQRDIDVMRASGRLGTSIRGAPGFDFDIEIHMGAGGYICGEGTAQIEFARRQAWPAARQAAVHGLGRLSAASRPSSTMSRRLRIARRSRSRAAQASPNAEPRPRPAPS